MASTHEDEIRRVRKMVKAYADAEVAVLVGNQAYTIGGQSLTRADLDKIRKGRHQQDTRSFL